MKYILPTLLLSLLLTSCHKKEARTDMILKGKIENFPVKKLYIAQANYWNIQLDSFDVKDGQFNYTFDSTKFKQPFLVSLNYLGADGKPHPIGVIDYVRSTVKDTFSNTGFRLMYGVNEITGDWNDRFHRMNLKPNSENDLMFAGKAEAIIASKNADDVKHLIQKNENSYHLISLLNNYKERYSKKDLEKLLTYFDKDIAGSKEGVRVSGYAGYLLADDRLPPEIMLYDTGFNRVNLQTHHPLKMIVFWASWCGPCRAEIPHLKELAGLYDSSILNITSVSIDEDSRKWQQAYREEKMPWRQLHVSQEDLLQLQAQFRFNSIPKVVFVDEGNKIVKEFNSFREDNVKRYSDFIRLRKQL